MEIATKKSIELKKLNVDKKHQHQLLSTRLELIKNFTNTLYLTINIFI